MRGRWSIVFFLVTTLLFFPLLEPGAVAQTIHVPGDQPDFQSAIDASADGDTIVLADGTYYGNFLISGKSIVVESGNGPENCILDGNGAGPTLSILNDEGTGNQLTLTGLCIRNGQGESLAYQGAGINCRGMRLAINHCRIMDNDGFGLALDSYSLELRESLIQSNLDDAIFSDLVTDVYAVNTEILGNAGSGINTEGDITLEQCTIEDNTGAGVYNRSLSSSIVTISQSTFRGNGTGVKIQPGNSAIISNTIIENQSSSGVNVREDTSTTVRECLIQGNGGPGIYSEGDGCAVTVWDSQIKDNLNSGIFVGFQASVSVYNTELKNNVASSPPTEPYNWENSGGAVFVAEGGLSLENCLVASNHGDWGGGIAAEWGGINIKNCVFENNTARQGGAIALGGGSLRLSGSKIFNNTCEESGGGIYIGVYAYNELTNNMIFGNSANRGGGLALDTATGGSPYSSRILNNTIVNNTAAAYGGGILGGAALGADTPMAMVNTIVWGNTAPVDAQFHNLNSDPPLVILNCDIDAPGYEGTNGNLRLAPLFADPENGDFHLAIGSPLIDQGTDTLSLPDVDIDGNVRVYDGDNDLTAIVDIGADEFVNVVAGFSADATVGLPPFSVQFADLSEGEPVSWLWDFGDGATSTDQHPEHTYTGVGTFSVTLTATNPNDSDSETKTDFITVMTPVDSDGDGVFDHLDPDDDNDGVVDTVDEFPFDPDEWRDTDSDSLGDNADPDDDNDGILDDGDGSGVAGDNPCAAGNTSGCDDNCPYEFNETQTDTDGNGVGDVCDAVDPSTSSTPTLGDAPSSVSMTSYFQPSAAERHFCRDAMTADYGMIVHDTAKQRLAVDSGVYPHVFTGSMQLNITDFNQFMLIPSVAPDSHILSYDLEGYPVDFFMDSAGNHYIRTNAPPGEHAFYWTVGTDYEKYTDENIPEDVSIDDIPPGVLRPVPPEVTDKVSWFIDWLADEGDIDLVGETNIAVLLNYFIPYFSDFTCEWSPVAPDDYDEYQILVTNRQGRCELRAFAFFVTMNGLGIPTRFVEIMGHAFTEVYMPDTSGVYSLSNWRIVDLGGCPAQVDYTDQRLALDPINVEITSAPAEIYRDEAFELQLALSDESGTPLADYPFTVYIGTDQNNRVLVNSGITGLDGTAILSSMLPVTVQSCENQAWIFGNPYSQYAGGWSDSMTTTVFEVGDRDLDDDIDGAELATFVSEYETENCDLNGSCLFDFNHDNRVDESDLTLFGLGFGRVDCIK